MILSSVLWKVSIRSPHGCKGRCYCLTEQKKLRTFQSAPLTDVRGDLSIRNKALLLSYVSIRSPHGCKGRSAPICWLSKSERVSIRSPHGCKGRCGWLCYHTQNSRVSIRSPHGCKGRFLARQGSPLGGLFQSAPLTDVRGDLLARQGSPLGGLFQSAPLTDVRGDRV